MEYNGPKIKRTGKSPLDEALDFIFAPVDFLATPLLALNREIKKNDRGGNYKVPQSMDKARTKRQNSVTAHPKARPGKAAGYAIGKMAKNVKRINGMKVR
jgi:hypothetical protein